MQTHTADDGIPRPGEVIAGKYAVERVLGAGGMGVVVLARHLVLGSHVAIKFMHGALLADPEPRRRFLQEAQSGAQLASEHVVRVLDVGELPSSAPYIVMEYVEGSDLGTLLRQRGSLPIEESVDYVLQACVGVAEAHARGIVHRDIKPANLFVSRQVDAGALVKVLDFGIAKSTSAASGARSLTGTLMPIGSPYYAAPEQLEDARRADERADIWALGVTLHELLTGRSPFSGASMASVIASIMTEAPIPVRVLRPEVSEDLEWIIARCLEKDPARRFQRVQELADRLVVHGSMDGSRSRARISNMPGQARVETVPLLASEPPAATSPPVSLVPPLPEPISPSASPAPRSPAVATPRRGLPRWAVAVVTVICLGLTVLGVVLLLGSTETDPPPLWKAPPTVPTVVKLAPRR